MKNIQVTDKDYELLMELSKELQTQTNNHQAFPYFWVPSSYKLELNYHDEGSVVQVIDNNSELQDLESYAENDEFEEYNKFLAFDDNTEDYERNKYHEGLEDMWEDWIRDNCRDCVITSDYEQQQDYNPTLFKSDADNYVDTQGHHLGKDPHTYSNTIYRMPKMISLIGAVCRLNKDVPEEEMNNEMKCGLRWLERIRKGN